MRRPPQAAASAPRAQAPCTGGGVAPICSGEGAPAITDTTASWARSHANASSSNVRRMPDASSAAAAHLGIRVAGSRRRPARRTVDAMPDSYGKRQRQNIKTKKAAAREERRLARAQRNADRDAGLLEAGTPIEAADPASLGLLDEVPESASVPADDTES